MTRRTALAVSLLVPLVGGCALLRGPSPDPAVRLAVRTAEYADAPDTATLRLFVGRDIALAGLSPVADASIGGVNVPGEPEAFVRGAVVLGLVPGRWPGLRDTLVVIAGVADAPTAAAIVEAATLLVARSHAGAAPDRSVAWALWDPTLTPEQGLARVRAALVWPVSRIAPVLVLASDAPPMDASAAGRLAETAERLAARPTR